MRIHSAADYPTGSEQNNQRLDMESHCILLIGYDDAQQVFNVVDPWQKRWEGAFSGQREMPYTSIYTSAVNCSLGEITEMALPASEVVYLELNGQRQVQLKIGFCRHRGYILDEKETCFTAFTITAKCDKYKLTRNIKGRWCIGEYAEIIFPISDELLEPKTMQFDVEAEIEGIRPYPYKDSFYYQFEEFVNIKPATEYLKKEDHPARVG